jgi:hypothetical protein
VSIKSVRSSTVLAPCSLSWNSAASKDIPTKRTLAFLPDEFTVGAAFGICEQLATKITARSTNGFIV